jgi:cell division protein ZapA (FtsZ GTPase activity inhibitor)
LKEYEKEHSKFQISDSKSVEFSELEKSLAEIDTDSLSPVEALMKLYELKQLVKLSSMSENITELKRATG